MTSEHYIRYATTPQWLGINGKHDWWRRRRRLCAATWLQISARATTIRRLKGNLLGRIIIGPTTMLLADGPFAAHKRHTRTPLILYMYMYTIIYILYSHTHAHTFS